MKKNLSLFLRWLTAAAVLTACIQLGYQCLRLYQGDAAPLFSAEKIAAALRQAAPLLLCCLAVILLSLLFHMRRPMQVRPVPLSPENRLRLMKKHRSALPLQAQQEERKRRFFSLLSGAGVLCCIVWCLFFLLNKDNFIPFQPDKTLENMLVHVTPALAAAGLMLYVFSLYADRSREKECGLLTHVSREMQPVCLKKRAASPAILRAVLLVAAVLFIVLGALKGDMRDMMNKAIKICTECIGLG